MNNLLIWIGWWEPLQSFWSTPVGLFCSFTLAATSTFRVMHRASHADLFDSVWFLLMSLVCTIAFLLGLYDHTPHHSIFKVLLVLMVLRGLYKCFWLEKRCRHV